MKVVIIFSLLICSIHCKKIDVKDTKELLKALEDVKPGDTIQLADGPYHNKFIAEKSGTASAKITLVGSRKAVISGYNYGFWLKANYWVLKGFTVTDCNKGIVLDSASHNTLTELEVHTIQEEGIHFRLHSADNTLQNSYLHDTGKGSPGFGEGVYIGSAVSTCLI